MSESESTVGWSSAFNKERHFFFPVESYVRFLYSYNYMLHSERVKDATGIASDELITYCEKFRMFEADSRARLYRCSLPPTYNEDLKRVTFVDATGKGTAYKFQGMHRLVNVADAMSTQDGSSKFVSYLNTTSAKDIKSNTSSMSKASSWWSSNKSVIDTFDRMINNYTLIPCFDASIRRQQERKLQNADVVGSDEGLQLTYMQLVGNKQSCYEKKKASGVSDPVANHDSMMYWIDLHQIHFKHKGVSNDGEVQREEKKTYTLCQNALDVHESLGHDVDFFTQKMKTVYRDTQTVMCPLDVFIVDDVLYSNDHKRIAASLLGGARYILGCVNQNKAIIKNRSVGYHPDRCFFSKSDKTMMVNFSSAKMEQLGGHYFIVVGDVNRDETELMHAISNFSIEERDKMLSAVVHRFDYVSSLRGKLQQQQSNTIDPEWLPSVEGFARAMQMFDGGFHHESEVVDKLHGCVCRRSGFLTSLMNCKRDYVQAIARLRLSIIPARHPTVAVGGASPDQLAAAQGMDDAFVDEIFSLPGTAGIPLKHVFNLGDYSADEYPTLRLVFPKKSFPFGIVFYKVKDLTENDRNALLDEMKSLILRTNLPPPRAVVDLPVRGLPQPPRVAKLDVGRALENIEHISSLIDQTVNGNALLAWELTEVCPNMGMLHENQPQFLSNGTVFPTAQFVFGAHIDGHDAKFPIHPVIKSAVNLLYSNAFKLDRGGGRRERTTRYNKSDCPMLEDFVLLFRHSSEFELGDEKHDQMFSSAEIKTWIDTKLLTNNHPILRKRFWHIYEHARLQKVIDVDAMVDSVLQKQEPDHIRLFKSVGADGPTFYGANQGLGESTRYSQLMEYDLIRDGRYALHLTKKAIADSILSGTSEKGAGLVLLGRYIHALGHIHYEKGQQGGGGPCLDAARWPYKLRLYKRFATRVGILVDMQELYKLYMKGHEGDTHHWRSVCGINEIGTVMFLKPVPPQALIAENRELELKEDTMVMFGDSTTDEPISINMTNVISPGSPYTMPSIFGLHSADAVLNQFENEALHTQQSARINTQSFF